MHSVEYYFHQHREIFSINPSVFAIFWLILYPIVFITYSYSSFLSINTKQNYGIIFRIVIHSILNLALNYILKTQENLLAALIVQTFIVISSIVIMVDMSKFRFWMTILQVPYILWLTTGLFLLLDLFFKAN